MQINSYWYPPIHQDIQIQKMILELLQVRSRLAETSSQLDTARREVVTLRETLEEYRSQLQHYNVKQTQTSPVIDRRRERERGVKNIAFWCKIGLRQFPLSSAQLFPAIPCSLWDGLSLIMNYKEEKIRIRTILVDENKIAIKMMWKKWFSGEKNCFFSGKKPFLCLPTQPEARHMTLHTSPTLPSLLQHICGEN